MNLANLSIVLVEPQGPLNIGSVCRVMMNFGISDLRLVNPEADHLGDDARRMAVKASTLLESAGIYPTLSDALADCCMALGTTRRFGKYREDFLHPDQAAEFLLPLTALGRVALVFGREDKGLLTAELDMCQRLLTIPTDEALPSMNLAQSVALCVYETAKAFHGALGRGAEENEVMSLATGAELDGMYGHMRKTLLDIGYLDPQNPDHILHTYRRILGRAGLNSREVRILHGLLSKIDWVEGERRKKS